MKELKLFWEGLWDISDKTATLNNIPESGGILMLIDACYTPNKIGFDTGTYRLIELIECSNMYSTISNISNLKRWKGQSHNHLLLKIARVDNLVQRQEILSILQGEPDAPAGLFLSNSGYRSPLQSRYNSPFQESAA
ncbi:MAG: hypothetical protein ACHQRM_10670 [Bacteroidia bacterium]